MVVSEFSDVFSSFCCSLKINAVSRTWKEKINVSLVCKGNSDNFYLEVIKLLNNGRDLLERVVRHHDDARILVLGVD